MKRSLLFAAGLIAMSASGAAAASSNEPIQSISVTGADGKPFAGAKFIVLDVDQVTGDYTADFASPEMGATLEYEEDGSKTYLHKTDGKTEMSNISDKIFNNNVDFQYVAAGVTDAYGRASFSFPSGSWDPDSGNGARPDLVVIVYQTEKGISRILGESSVTRDATGAMNLLVTVGSMSSLPQAQAQTSAIAAYTAAIAKLDFLALDAAMLALLRGPQTGSGWQANFQVAKSRADAITKGMKQAYPGQDAGTAVLAKALSDAYSRYLAAVQHLADLWQKGTLKPSDYHGVFRCWRLQQMLLYRLQFCHGTGTLPPMCNSSPEQTVSGQGGPGGVAVDKAVTQSVPTPAMGGLDIDDD
jgi:hypothetical protein